MREQKLHWNLVSKWAYLMIWGFLKSKTSRFHTKAESIEDFYIIQSHNLVILCWSHDTEIHLSCFRGGHKLDKEKWIGAKRNLKIKPTVYSKGF